MAYQTNTDKLNKMEEVLTEAIKVFETIKEETKTEGFKTKHVKAIMKPLWSFFDDQLPEDKKEILLDMKEWFKDFWKDCVVLSAMSEDNLLGSINPNDFFSEGLNQILIETGLYEKIKV